MKKELQELYLDLMEAMAYRELQVPSDSGSEDAYFEMDIQSLQMAIANAYYELRYCKPELKQNRKDRNRYRLNKKAKEKLYKSRIDWGNNSKPWRIYQCNKKARHLKADYKKTAEMRVRRQPIGEEEFCLKGCGFHKTYEWRWMMG